MFERLKFTKKKTDAALPSSQGVLPGPKAEATPEESAAFSFPTIHPSLLAGMQAPVSSTPSPTAYYTTNSNIDSGYGLGRSISSGSAHLRQKASLTSLNNNYRNSAGPDIPSLNNTDGVGHSLAHLSLMTPAQDSAASVIQNYKVPLGVEDAQFYVPDTPSQASTAYSHYTSTMNATLTPTTPTPVSVTDTDKRSSQGPKINPATKPSAGSFVGAIVTSATPISSSIELVSNSISASSNSSSSSDITVTPNNANNSGVPASSTSSATPSRSSSTSNRGGARMSPTGSFTPVSATPPLTPRMAHNEATNGQQDSQSHIPIQHQMTPVASTTSPVIFSAAAHVSSTPAPVAVASIGQYHQYQVPIVFGCAPETEDDGVTPSTITYVSSPTSYQPPMASLSSASTAMQSYQRQEQLPPQKEVYSQESLQYQGMPPIAEPRSTSTPGAGGERSKDSLMQQQRYQDQQLAQFREQLDDSCNRVTMGGPSDANDSVQHEYTPPTVIPTTTIAGSIDSSTHHNQAHISLVQGEMRSGVEHWAAHQHHSPTRSSINGHGVNGGTGPGHTPTASQSGGSTFFPMPLARTSTAMAMSHLITHDVRQKTEQPHSHIIDGAGPMMLMAIGKTGQGKSSLLNKIMGTSELKASASVRAVTKGIAERTGWGRFEDSRRVLVTLADTPGLADTEGDDEKNIPILKEYIKSVGKRIGVTAFLLVFKIDSGVDMILTILTTFDDIMKEFPDFWDNVILVFTGCDFRRNVMNTKQLYHTEIQRQLEERFFKERYNMNGGANGGNTKSVSQDSPSTNGPTSPTDENSGSPIVSMVFLTSAEAPCGFSLGEKCDCKARTTFLNAGLKRLWYAVKSKKRWVLEEDEDDGLLGHS
ncbi:hypothetical protein B0O80DRAFT_452933 [Mortierella sp. GBAus27b]|nr:hypothetical protein B0O80DRAFT_452933 [Mortierella sp. GBAus27b]